MDRFDKEGLLVKVAYLLGGLSAAAAVGYFYTHHDLLKIAWGLAYSAVIGIWITVMIKERGRHTE